MTALSDNVVSYRSRAEERGMHRGWIPVAAAALALMAAAPAGAADFTTSF
jgi:hypothetical protein